MNLVEVFKAGQSGKNKGLPMGEGLENISMHIGGVQKAKIYVIAASPKGGKSTFADAGFVIEPCIYVLDHNAKIEEQIAKTDPDEEEKIASLRSQMIYLDIIYFSYEIDRVTKEFDFMAHFIERDYGISYVTLPSGKTYRRGNTVPISSSFLMGELVYDQLDAKGEREVILVPQYLEAKMRDIYLKRIIPLFGEYNSEGTRIKRGLIFFFENRDNPTGMRNTILSYAESKGTLKYIETQKGTKVSRRLVGYTPHNSQQFTLVVTDHLRKVHLERDFNLKQAVDKFSEYSVELKNICYFSFVHIIHLNRAMADIARRKLDGDSIYPMSDDIKETGNLSEDANYIFTMFNPNDDKYNLKKHFGLTIRNNSGGLLYPNMRTIHLVEARNCEAPKHFRVNMFGGIKKFEKLII